MHKAKHLVLDLLWMAKRMRGAAAAWDVKAEGLL